MKVALPRPLDVQQHRRIAPRRSSASASAPPQDGKITAIGHESWSGDLPGGKPEAAVQPDAAALCRRQPHDGDAAGRARPARRQRDARAGRGARHDGARDRHGRDGREARARSRSSSASSTTRRSIRRSRTRPFSQRQLIECLRTGAERFGWSKRNATPGAGARRPLAGRHGRGRRASATTW